MVEWLLSTAVLTAGAGPAAAAAEAAADLLTYNPSDGSQYFESVAGVMYVVLVVWFLTRTISRRVKKFTNEKISSGPTPSKKSSVIMESDQDKAVTPFGALTGAAIAFAISLLLYQLCVKVDDYFAHQPVSPQFTVQKLQIAIQTIVRGLVYLCTFTFAANAAGLVGLAGALIFNPDAVKDEVIQRPPRDPLLDVTASKRILLPKLDNSSAPSGAATSSTDISSSSINRIATEGDTVSVVASSRKQDDSL